MIYAVLILMVVIHGWFGFSAWNIFRWRAEIDPLTSNVVNSWTETTPMPIGTGTGSGYHAVTHKVRQNRFSVQYSSKHFHGATPRKSIVPAGQAVQASNRMSTTRNLSRAAPP